MGLPQWTLEKLVQYSTPPSRPSARVQEFFRPLHSVRHIARAKEVLTDASSLWVEINRELVYDLGEKPVQDQIRDVYTTDFSVPEAKKTFGKIADGLLGFGDDLEEALNGRSDEYAQNARSAIQEGRVFAQNLKNITDEQLATARNKITETLKKYFNLSHARNITIKEGLEMDNPNAILEDIDEKKAELKNAKSTEDTFEAYLQKNFAPKIPEKLREPTVLTMQKEQEQQKEELTKLIPEMIRAIQKSMAGERTELPNNFLSIKKPDGTPLFAKISMEEWNAENPQHPEQSWKNISPSGFAFDTETQTILLRDDHYFSIESGKIGGEIFSGLGHEMAHFVDYYAKGTINGKKVGAAGLQELITKHSNTDLKARVLALKFTTESAMNKWEELFASLVVGGNKSPEIEYIASILLGDPEFTSLLERTYQSFGENFGVSGSASQKIDMKKLAGQGHAESDHHGEAGGDPDDIHDHKTLEYWKTQIKSAQVSNRKKVKAMLEDCKLSDGTEHAQGMLNYMDEELENFEHSPKVSAARLIIDNHDARAGKFTGDLNKLGADISEKMAHKMGEGSYFTDFWNNTRFLSMRDLGRLWETFTHYISHKHESNSKRRAGFAGHKIFKGLWKMEPLADDFEREELEAEEEAVNHHKKALEHKDAHDIMHFIEHASDIDELKAGLRELAHKGHINWNDKVIWKKITQFSGVRFYDSDRYNPALRNSKIQRACKKMWGDADEYPHLESENQSNIESHVKKFAVEAESYANRLPAQIEKMLYDNKNHKHVDIHRFEAFVNALAKAGKGDPEMFFYYLVAGVSAKILTPERGVAITGEHTNDWPPLQIIDGMNPDQSQYEEWSKQMRETGKKLDKDYKFAKPTFYPGSEAVRTFMYLNVMEYSGVMERILANKDGAKLDHDHARLLACVGDESMAYSITAGATGGNARFKTTIYNNLQVGILSHITNIAQNKNKMPDDELRKIIARQAAYQMTMDGLLKERLWNGKNATYRFKHNDLMAIPREAGTYNKKINTAGYMERNNDIYSSIPTLKKFFDIILDPRSKGESGEAAIGRLLGGEYDKTTGEYKEGSGGLFKTDQKFIDMLGPNGINKPVPRTAKEGFALIQELVEFALDPEKNPSTAESDMASVLKKANDIYKKDNPKEVAKREESEHIYEHNAHGHGGHGDHHHEESDGPDAHGHH